MFRSAQRAQKREVSFFVETSHHRDDLKNRGFTLFMKTNSKLLIRNLLYQNQTFSTYMSSFRTEGERETQRESDTERETQNERINYYYTFLDVH